LRLNKPKNEVKRVELLYSHRCPAQVLRLANATLALNRMLAGGKSDKSIYTEINIPQEACEGEVEWISKADFEKKSQDIQRSPNRAYITPVVTPEMIDKYGALVFKPSEIRGFEFKEIVLLDFFSQPIFYEINRIVAKLSTEHKEKKNRAKAGEAESKYRSDFNELHIALTRTLYKLTVVQDETRLGALLGPLKKVTLQRFGLQPQIPLEADPVYNDSHWYAQIDKMLQHGQIDIAQRIFDTSIKGENKGNFAQYQQRNTPLPQPSSSSRLLTTPEKAIVPVKKPNPFPKGAITISPAPIVEKKQPPACAPVVNSEEVFVGQLFTNFSPNNMQIAFAHPRAKAYLFDIK